MKKNKVLFIILGIAVLIGIIILVIPKHQKNSGDRSTKKYESVFFIKQDNKYALFNDDGTKLSDFIYTYAGSFVNGSALVKNENSSGVINTNGKMVIDFDQYKYVTQQAGLYKVTDEENNSYLLNSKGKKLFDLKDMSLTTYAGVNSYSLLYDKKENKYNVLNQNGDVMVTFSKGDSSDQPSTNEVDNFVSVFHNNKNYILDAYSGKKVLDFESNDHYCVNKASDDGKIITLNSCVGMFQSQDKTTYKFIKDNKLYDLSDKCDSISYYDGNLTCTKDSKKYLLDSNLNVGINIDGAAYADTNYYAKLKSGSFNGVDFYQKDDVIKNVECRSLSETGYMKQGYYLLSTYYSKTCGTSSGTYEFYNTKGEKMFSKSFTRAQKFDSNSLARVSEDSKNYYLIDTKGNKVCDDYDNIVFDSDYYVVTKDNLSGVLDTKGKKVTEAKYSKVDVLDFNGKKYIKINDKDSKVIIYNIATKKEIMTFDSNPTLNEHYMSVTKDGKKEYYTYSGKLFYTEQ